MTPSLRPAARPADAPRPGTALAPLLWAWTVIGALAACDEGPFAVEVVAFTPGEGAGFGADLMPGVVLGPPHGSGKAAGGTDVVSLGHGGSIVVRMGRAIADVDGADFIVFENAFQSTTGALFAEAGEVAVSDDGRTFTAFPCAPTDAPPNGCAGFAPVFATDDAKATDPQKAGGDAFDLADLGLAGARYVRVVDRGTGAVPPSAGFDLDAVAVVEPAR